MNAMTAAGDSAGILFQLVGVIALVLAGYVFVESAIKATPAGGWALAAAILGIALWPLIASLTGAFSFQKGLADTPFASAGHWLWLGCLAAAPLALLICLGILFRRLWRTAIALAAGGALIVLGYLLPSLARMVSGAL